MTVKIGFAGGNEQLYDLKGRSDECGLVCDEPSRTVQADAEDADINTIVRRFNITGQLPAGGIRVPEFADYEDVFDFHSAQLAILVAEQTFMQIPADVRARFHNDPGEFLHFAADPGNIDALREMGLAMPKPVEIVPVVPVVDKPV